MSCSIKTHTNLANDLIQFILRHVIIHFLQNELQTRCEISIGQMIPVIEFQLLYCSIRLTLKRSQRMNPSPSSSNNLKYDVNLQIIIEVTIITHVFSPFRFPNQLPEGSFQFFHCEVFHHKLQGGRGSSCLSSWIIRVSLLSQF